MKKDFALFPHRQALIESALIEFTNNTFALASTNKIAANSQISKGIIYYYFTSKEKLFNYLFHYALDELQPFIQMLMTTNEQEDQFDRMIRLTKLKVELFTTSLTLPFIASVIINLAEWPLNPENLRYYKKVEAQRQLASAILFKLNPENLKPGICVMVAENIVRNYTKGISETCIELIKKVGIKNFHYDFRQYHQELYLLKSLLYKEER